MNVGITGSSGFLGSSIINKLNNKFNFQKLNLRQINLESETEVHNSFSKLEALIHLAGISSIAECERNPKSAYDINVKTSIEVAENYYRKNNNGHFIFASTGQVYDELDDLPHTEFSKIAPGNLYAETKLKAELELSKIAIKHGSRLTILRLFNHTHKTQSIRAVMPSIHDQLIKSNEEVVRLTVGNIDLNRDLSSVQDVMSAIEKLLFDNQKLSGVNTYNLSSGVDKNLRQIIVLLAEKLHKKILITVDPSRLRTSDPLRVVGDPTKFENQFNWFSRSKSISSFIDLFLEEL